MMRYRKKPVELDAVKWDGDLAVIASLVPSYLYTHAGGKDLELTTVDGNHVRVPLGAYVVMDPKGYPYPCDADIFESSHEPIP